MKKYLTAFILTALLSLFYMPDNVAAASSPVAGKKKTLYFSLVPKKNVDQQILELSPLLELLEERLNRPIEVIRPQSYNAVIEGVISQTIDFAILGPASYAKARAIDNGVDAFASFKTKKGYLNQEGSFYNSALFTLQNLKYRSIPDLKGRKVALTDPESTSGAIIPNMEFSKYIGSPLKTFFGSLIYTGSHDRSIDAVLNGLVDAAFVSTSRIDEALTKGKLSQDNLVILWRSKPIHYDPFVFSSGVDESLRNEIKTVMLSSPPELEPMLDKMEMAGIVAVDNEDYRAIHDIIAKKIEERK